MIVASTLTVPRCYALPKQNYTGARDFVERNRHSGDAVVAVGLAGVAYSKYFAAQWPMWKEAQTQSELDAVRKGHSEVWLVYTIPIQVKAYRPEIWRAIESDFEVVKVFPGTLGGGEVFVCRQKMGNIRIPAGSITQHKGSKDQRDKESEKKEYLLSINSPLTLCTFDPL